MTVSTFVGRDQEINKLISVLQLGSQGQGRVVFVEGEAGAGKSLFLQALQEKVQQLPDADKMRFVYGYCYEDSGNQNAYQPFVEVLSTLLAKNTSKEGFAKLFLTIVKETGSDWLGMIPGIGPAISASLKTATIIAGQWLSGNESKSTNQQSETLLSQYIQTISKIADKFSPLVLLIEDGHWIDDASSRLLERLSQKINEKQLIVVVTYRPSYISENHPLLRARNEIIAKSRGDIVALGGLNSFQINEYITRRFGSALHPRLADWLALLCKGNPLFMTQYLSLLEQERIIQLSDGKYILDGELKLVANEWKLEGRLKEITVPNSVEALLEQRIKRLVEEDQEMLQLGAVQGELFMSSVLAELLDKNETDILKRLRKVIDQHRLISLYTGSDFDKTRTEVYTFEHILLQQALYNKLSPRERILYHRDIAAQLVKMISDEPTPSRKMLLDIAHHYDLGQIFQSAANYYSLAAESLILDRANIEAIEIARRAWQNITQVPDASALKAKIIVQLLTVNQEHINTQGYYDDLQITNLIKDANDAAKHTNDPGLMAQVKFIEAKYQGALSNLKQSIETCKEAIKLIEQAQDPIGEYVITSFAGHNLCGVDLRSGLDMQYRAQNIFNMQVKTSFEEIPKNLKRYYFLTQTRIGVGEFDSGNFGISETLLVESADELRKLGFLDELIWSLNFMSQLYITIGAFDLAEKCIREAISIDQTYNPPSNVYCYNLSLLGKLYVEWNRVAEAEQPLQKGFEQGLKAAIKWELPLIRNYYAELLLNSDFTGMDIDEAVIQLDINIEETRKSDFHRSLVGALSLRGLAALAQKLPAVALDFSTQAVTHLQEMGSLPALRTEEIFFNHYKILLANDKIDDANINLKRAYEVLIEKAESITNLEHRKSFLESVNLSREIIAAVNNV